MHCSIRPPVSCGIFPLVKSNRNQKTLELRWNDLLVVKQGKAQWVVRVNVFVCMCACAYVLQEPEDTQTPAILLIAYFYERNYKILFFKILILKTAFSNSLICLRYLGSFLVFFFFKFSYRLCNVINTFFNLCIINLNIIFSL